MNRLPFDHYPFSTDFPRASGDEPYVAEFPDAEAAFSPREWG